ncbi:MAG: DUF924 domain-containing protein [Betaproteobacteria bacterium]|nr:DUF924 domain-containing protein [Betaproteobacteria bacterium]
MLDQRYHDVLTFWFGPAAERHLSRKAWFQKDPDFDANIRDRFLPLFEEAEAGGFDNWRDHAQSCLALLIVLDQFPRNLFRGEARAFACDARARIVARHAIALGYDREWHPVQRMFAYLPLEHSESIADQEECLRLMKTLMPYPETADMHVWAEKHRVIIERFGRFPHRNAALGRESTPEEIEFLKQPGSGF